MLCEIFMHTPGEPTFFATEIINGHGLDKNMALHPSERFGSTERSVTQQIPLVGDSPETQ